MFVLLSITILVLAALAMLILRMSRPNFGYHWLIAAGGAFSAWLVILLIYTTIPDTMQIFEWGAWTTYQNLITLTVDRYSWPFAAALGTLLIATLLSDVARAHDLSWSNWAGSLVLVAIGLVGVFSGNLITFILSWTAFDLVVMVTLLLQLDAERLRRRAVWVFFIHLLGTLCLLLAGVISIADSNSVLLLESSPRAVLFVVFAAGFRIAAMPLDSQMQVDLVGRRSFGTIRSLASMAIVVVLLVRIATTLEDVQIPAYLRLGVFSLIGLMAALYSLAWFYSKDELEGRQAWIVVMGMLVIASTLHAEVGAGLAWGLAAVFSGGLISLASVRRSLSRWITLTGLVGICMLPFTPAWGGARLLTAAFSIPSILYLITLIFIILGYVRHASQLKPEPPGLERWIKVVYPLGLLVLPLTQLGLGWMYRPEMSDATLIDWIIGPVFILLTAAGYMWLRRGGRAPQGIGYGIGVVLNFRWLRSLISIIYNLFSQFISFSSNILEGEGGFLWVLLSIVLFMAILLISIGS